MNIDESYARTLERLPTMSAAEQAALAARYARTRNPRDAERLVLGNLRLVVKIARELGPYRADLMDLIQEGNAGLTCAVKRFDPGRGVKLTTYAVWWIRAFIMRHLMATSRMVSFASTREGRRRFFLRDLPGPDRSLDARGSKDDEGGSAPGRALLDVLADDEDDRPDVRCEENEYRARLQRAVDGFRPTLDKRGRGILEMRLLRDEPALLKDVGKRFAISGERVRQLETRVRNDLRRHVAGALGEPERAVA
ncbi:MAG TPA: sigma-70 family RNA polymerase sigma factor [Polyangia bacterium]|nr:sigma-70 family RNA polymerase sigma factor [Polyangia bacterium]